ncbi:MAG: FHA domain-containing protein [Prochloraceae cyanobacterium]|nr:FHA domain-containing protein [Prochloraceae cyanobacterium]
MNGSDKQFEHILAIEDRKGQRIITLNQKMYSLGRSTKNSIVIFDRQVSRTHATIIKQQKGNRNCTFWIYDGNLQGKRSTNGIVINKKRLLSHQLQVGDLIMLGDNTVLKYYQFSTKTVQLLRSAKKLGNSTISTILMSKQEIKQTVVL